MRAWLITWDWTGDAAVVADEVAGVLNPRWADRRVGDIVEFLYSNVTANISELAYYAKRPSNNPYRAEISKGRIYCGHNPSLYARIVSDLEIEIGSDGKESITWMEPPIYDLISNKVQMVQEPIPGAYKRRITGPVSHEQIWDRMNSKFRKGWGLGEIPE